MIDPSTVTSDAARRTQSTFPAKVRSEATISYKPPDLSSMSDESDSEDDEDAHGLTVSPADIRVIRRIAARANVLPVIARADSLTDAKLAAVKRVVRRDLRAADLDFGVFGPVAAAPEAEAGSVKSVLLLLVVEEEIGKNCVSLIWSCCADCVWLRTVEACRTRTSNDSGTSRSLDSGNGSMVIAIASDGRDKEFWFIGRRALSDFIM